MGSQAHNKRFLESMIWSGAFDCFGVPRSWLHEVYDAVVERVAADRKNQVQGQLTLFDAILQNDEKLNKVEYPNIPEYTNSKKLQLEKDVVGVYISGHPLEPFRAELDAFGFNSSMLEGEEIKNEFDEVAEVIYTDVKDGQSIKCGGIITEVKKLSTKTNKDMAILTVEDLFGVFDVMVFSSMYEKHRDKFLENNIVNIKGKISIRENEKPIVLLEDINNWDTSTLQEQKNVPTKKLYLKFDFTNEILKSQIRKILQSYSGDIEVKVRCACTNGAYIMEEKVDGSQALLNELLGLLDENCIKLL